MTVEPRKYAMTKIRPGDWLCPNNEGTLLWRFSRYYESGDALSGEWPNERPIIGWFWSASFMPLDDFTSDALDCHWSDSPWTEWHVMLPSRDTAIAEMLEHSATIASR